MSPHHCEVAVYKVQNPTMAAWQGLKIYSNDAQWFEQGCLTRSEYFEQGGVRAANLKFNM